MTDTLYSIFDSHAHYDAEQFNDDRDEILTSLPKKGVVGIVNMGTDIDTCLQTIALTEKYDYLYGAAGIHPECAKDLPANWLTQLRTFLKHDKIKAVGEIGLDYHWLELCPKETQKEVLTAQLALANELDYPVVLHDREAHGDMMDFLREYRPKGVVHCFSGSVEMAREVIKLGLYIGLDGPVTFKNARHSVEVAKDIPLERLLLETDAPYMSPEPLRGKRNDSANIRYIGERIAEIRGVSPEVIFNATTENTKRLFGID
ncbi:TatD family hydrolase [Scatolibacter rhodanostii]|uniref:TatD family hydrolase n=1 Tax=Scatolibacter rhodanostii TaxID=2014781 RepID=UPI000C076DD9|nr:TatD family hydrolase [Scatolibacter rhodanostii]